MKMKSFSFTEKNVLNNFVGSVCVNPRKKLYIPFFG